MNFGRRSNKMAKRICFISSPHDFPIYKEIVVEFAYFTGFAISQKQKSISSMHVTIENLGINLQVLEVSTKSSNPIGVALSAFNLQFLNEINGKEYPLENIFQSSKVFENGGPYRDLLDVHPKDAKRDERLKNSGNLICFDYNGTKWELEPKTMFYDWIYIRSLCRNEMLSKKILEYNAFTDIEFNQEKSINCQARAAAIFVSLSVNGLLPDILDDLSRFKEIYFKDKPKYYQTSFLE